MNIIKPSRTSILTIALGAMIPAALHAATTHTIDFDSSADAPTSTVTVSTSPALAVSGGLLTGVASSGDPRLIWNTATVSSTPIVSKLETETWTTIIFHVRETADPLTPGTVVNTFNATGLVIQLNSNNSATAATNIITTTLYSASTIGVDGFFTVTADISSFLANDIRYFRLDPIGGTDATNNRFEVDFIQINAIPEPSAMLLGSLGTLVMLRRRR